MKKNLKELPIYFIDLETTGLSPEFDRIIEFCIIKTTKIGVYKIYNKVDPEEVSVSQEAKKVNGYCKRKWINSISQKEAMNKIHEFISEKGVFCGHNINFDISFLKNSMNRIGYPLKSRRNIDTYALAFEHLVPMGLNSLSLDSIRSFLSWKKPKYHNASGDAHDVYRLYHYLNRMGYLRKSYIWLRSYPYRRNQWKKI